MPCFKAKALSQTELNLPPFHRDIVMLDASNQPQDSSNPCHRLGNGNCEQLCFSYPQVAIGSDCNNMFDHVHDLYPQDAEGAPSSGRKCACSTGTIVSGRKCSVSPEYLVFATRTEIRSEQKKII